MTKQEHVTAAVDFAKMACVWSETWSALVNQACLQYGDGRGVLISGIYRDHFPDHIKDALRVAAHSKTACLDASVRHWTQARRRNITWRRMYDDVQSNYGG